MFRQRVLKLPTKVFACGEVVAEETFGRVSIDEIKGSEPHATITPLRTPEAVNASRSQGMAKVIVWLEIADSSAMEIERDVGAIKPNEATISLTVRRCSNKNSVLGLRPYFRVHMGNCYRLVLACRWHV